LRISSRVALIVSIFLDVSFFAHEDVTRAEAVATESARYGHPREVLSWPLGPRSRPDPRIPRRRPQDRGRDRAACGTAAIERSCARDLPSLLRLRRGSPRRSERVVRAHRPARAPDPDARSGLSRGERGTDPSLPRHRSGRDMTAKVTAA